MFVDIFNKNKKIKVIFAKILVISFLLQVFFLMGNIFLGTSDIHKSFAADISAMLATTSNATKSEISDKDAGRLRSNMTIWPRTESYFYDDNINIDDLIKEATVSNSRKGFLLTGDIGEIFELGASHVAVNVTLSGAGHTYIQILKSLKEKGINITLILVNDQATVGMYPLNAPYEYQHPYFYMMDFGGVDGQRQYMNFKRILDDYGDYVDNWIIGNEINSQLYNFYGPLGVADYTRVYCYSFAIMYDEIKRKNPDANCFISFDQGWDAPYLRADNSSYNFIYANFQYNIKEMLYYINEYLDKDIDWGIALHPYPAPVSDAKFWDDEFAGFDEKAKDPIDRPYMMTLKNFELMLYYINQPEFRYKKDNLRKVMVTEFGVTSHQGEEIQAAGLYYFWEKMKKYDQIMALLYNAQTDVPDGYNFGLSDSFGRKRLAWVVFRDMDDPIRGKWCKDLLDRILDQNGYVDLDTVLVTKETYIALKEQENMVKKQENIIIPKVTSGPQVD